MRAAIDAADAGVTPDMTVFRVELFGPVAAVSRAKDADHALANTGRHPIRSNRMLGKEARSFIGT